MGRLRECLRATVLTAATLGPLACGGSRGAAPQTHPDAGATYQLAFTDIRAAAGLGALGGPCLVFEDLDGDGHPDILAESYDDGQQPALVVFVNTGGGSFRAQPFPEPLVGFLSGACAAADFDADGLVDVAIGSSNALEVHVFHNLGGATFQKSATLVGPPPAQSSTLYLAVAAADFDGDGWVDVIASPFEQPPDPSSLDCGPTADGYSCAAPAMRCARPGVVFRNMGGAFAAPAEVDPQSPCGPANANAIAVTDWNGDGRPDAFVANDWGVDSLYVQGSAALQFEDAWSGLDVKKYNHGMGAAFADFDSDGNLDVYVSDLGSDQLYFGTGSGALSPGGQGWGVSVATQFHSGWAPLAEDFDDDGLVDVWVVNSALVRSFDDLKAVGTTQPPLDPRAQSDFLFHNVAGQRFDLVQVVQTADAEPTVTYGASATADLDGDGRLDILEMVGIPMRLQLLHNLGTVGRWVDVRLQGRTSNRDGLGAVVTLAQPGSRPQTRLVQRTRGSIGSSWAVAHFGLGASGDVDTITVRWPSGKTQIVTPPIQVDGVMTIAEP